MFWENLNLIPNISMSFDEKLFTILKLLFFIALISTLVFNDVKYVLFVIILLFVGIFIYNYYINTKKNAEEFLDDNNIAIIDKSFCTKPSLDNPFMNPNILDYQTPNRISACSVDNSKINNEMHDKFIKRIFKDVNDIYGKTISERQFYTLPSTTIPNDQEGLGKWLYFKDKTCKENNGVQCYNNRM
jgi:hypothetical protein